jgi:asparagine synthase (glutamine-hydrolysing)
MCGIAGILSHNLGTSLQTRIEKMQQAIRHRGPDGEGIFISENRQTAIAHTRLAILDLSAAGHQPMCSGDRRYWISFNGEIYNFQCLRQDLIAQGEKFDSQTDTEVILKLYQRLGKDCLKLLRGMFALAIWDELEQICFLARDPLGIKPLYYWQENSTLVFASELKAVLASGFPSKTFSNAGLYGYLLNGSVPEPHTLIEGIKLLEAGHWLDWHAGKTSDRQYWQFDFTPNPISADAAREKVRKALEDSMQAHLVSDVPVGIFLSGGIDSSSLLALATASTPAAGSTSRADQLRTYSIAFAETKWNEGEIARQVANHFGAIHTEHQITATSAKQLFEQYLQAIDQPSIDGFNTFCVSKVAREDGTKVVISGLGGDEVFGGYQSFQKIPQMVEIGKKVQAIPFAGKAIGMGLSRWGKSSKVKRIGDFLQVPANVSNAYSSFRGIFSESEASTIADSYVSDRAAFSSLSQTLHASHNLPENQLKGMPSLTDRVSYFELSRYMRNQLLRDSDVMSMHWGLELRVPLVDRVLLESVSDIPSELRLAEGKKLLVSAMPELPDFLRDRPKQGFSFPFEQWLKNEWKADFEQTRSFDRILLQPWYRQLSIMVLDYWWQSL